MNDFMVIEDWLPQEKALDIAARIGQINDWDARICDRDGGPRIIDHASLKALGITAEEYARSYPESLQALGRGEGGSMAYLFFVKHLSKFDPELHKWWLTEILSRVSRVTGEAYDYFEEPLVCMYSSGCFLGQHTDGVGDRKVACIANFTKDWQPDFGGSLTILSKGNWTVVPPTFNSLALMDVNATNCHYVSQVASWVTNNRTTITGWACRR